MKQSTSYRSAIQWLAYNTEFPNGEQLKFVADIFGGDIEEVAYDVQKVIEAMYAPKPPARRPDRRPIGERAMTDAERKRASRARIKQREEDKDNG